MAGRCTDARVFTGVGELEDKNPAVRMKRAASGGLGFLHGIVREDVRDFGDESGGRERFVFDLERSLPDAQMVARSDDADGLGVRPAVILRAAKEVELAHGHGQVRFFRKTAEDAMEHGIFNVGVDFHPASSGEGTLHGSFGAEYKEINHVARIAVFVADPAGNLREELGVNAGKRSNLLYGDASGAVLGSIDFNADGVVTVAGVVAGLIDAYREAAGHWSEHVAARADQKRLSNVLVADAADERAAACFVERKHAEKILESASEAVGAVVLLRVGITELAGGGKEHVFTGLHVDAAVHPCVFAGELDLLGEAFLAGRLGKR